MADQDRLGSENAVNIALAIQRMGRDAYGVTIRREIAACTGRKMSIAILYSQLARLERDGMVRTREGEPTPERLGRPKRLYELTGKGERALNSALMGFERLRAPMLAPTFGALRVCLRRVSPITLSLLIGIGWTRFSLAFGGDGDGDGDGGGGDGGGNGGVGETGAAHPHWAVLLIIFAFVIGWFAEVVRRQMAITRHEATHWDSGRLSNQAPSAPFLLDAICGVFFPPKKRKTSLADLLEFYRDDCDEWKERYGEWPGILIANVYYVRNAIEMVVSCYFQLLLEVIKAWRKGA